MMLYCFNKNVCFVALDPNAVSMLCIAYSLFLFIIKKSDEIHEHENYFAPERYAKYGNQCVIICMSACTVVEN